MTYAVRVTSLIASILVGLFTLLGCDATETAPPAERLQVAPNVTLAGAIDGYSDIELRKEDTLVVDLRLVEEGAQDAKARFGAAGIRYAQLPMGRDTPTLEQVQHLERILSENTDRPILLHCSSGNRAGLLWASHLIEQGVAVDEAVSRVSSIANRESVQQAIRNYAGGRDK